ALRVCPVSAPVTLPARDLCKFRTSRRQAAGQLARQVAVAATEGLDRHAVVGEPARDQPRVDRAARGDEERARVGMRRSDAALALDNISPERDLADHPADAGPAREREDVLGEI